MKEIVEMMARAILDADLREDDIICQTSGYPEEVTEQFARAALTAIEQAGFVVVPKEPTEAMLAAGAARHNGWDAGPGHSESTKDEEAENSGEIYRAMIEAATRDERGA